MIGLDELISYEEASTKEYLKLAGSAIETFGLSRTYLGMLDYHRSLVEYLKRLKEIEDLTGRKAE